MTEKTSWRVGELAKQTGLSVRTLHYYDQIGLLVPSRNKGNGHRLYTGTDIVRLQQIIALKHLGYSLYDIKEFLQGTDYSPGRVINLHINQLREHIKNQQNLCRRLEIISENLQSQKKVTAEQFIEIIAAVKSAEKYPLSREQENSRKRREEILRSGGKPANRAGMAQAADYAMN